MIWFTKRGQRAAWKRSGFAGFSGAPARQRAERRAADLRLRVVEAQPSGSATLEQRFSAMEAARFTGLEGRMAAQESRMTARRVPAGADRPGAGHRGPMSAAEIAEQLRIEQQIPADIARTTQELLYEPRKYRVQFAGGGIISAWVRRGWCRWRRCCRGLHQRASSGTATNRNLSWHAAWLRESNPASCDTPEKPDGLRLTVLGHSSERNLC